MRKFIAILMVCILGLSLSACQTGKNEDNDLALGNNVNNDMNNDIENENDSKTLKIGVSLLTREHVYYNKIEEALIEAAPGMNFELIIQDAKSDANLQINQMQDFVTQKVDAIILCPVNSAGVESGVKTALAADIPVFTMDIQTEGDGIICHVGIDNYEGGKLSAKYANDVLNGEGEVAIIGYDEVSSCADRTRGFIDGLKDYPDIKLVDNQNSSGSAEKSANIMQDMILKHPNLKLVFGVGDPFALGALQSIITANKEIYVIGFDGSDQAIDEIKKDGLFLATVWDDPTQLGKTTLEKVKDYFDGKDVPKIEEYEPRMLDKTNI